MQRSIDLLPVGRICIISLMVAAASVPTFASKLVYITRSNSSEAANLDKLISAAGYYGVSLERIVSKDNNRTLHDLNAIAEPSVVGVVIEADALPSTDEHAILSRIRRRKNAIPVLITGINENTGRDLLTSWTHGAAAPCDRPELVSGRYFVAQDSVVGQLAGVSLPLRSGRFCSLTLRATSDAAWLLAAGDGNTRIPVFARVYVDGTEIFLLSARPSAEAAPTADPYRLQAVFATIAPEMIFVRRAAGDRGWHSSGHYANLTIDDAWLREPYGHVNYDDLLGEMESHNFHTTIAFIPWNFDRSQPQVVRLFREHPDRFSVCVHGNNHDHEEFGPYSSRPIREQVQNVRQGLARMIEFSHITQVPYDAVMVFPHDVAPEETLSILKEYNYEATVNSLNVPQGAELPSDAKYLFRVGTLKYSNFLSLRRYSAEASLPPGQLEVEAFLGNPDLFYVHEAFFADGAGAFDGIADRVNRLQPDTEWKPLSFISRHSYLERLNDVGDYDVQMLSRVIELKNSHSYTMIFHVMKEEDFRLPFDVKVDGNSYPYLRAARNLMLDVSVPARSNCLVEIIYHNSLNPAQIDISKRSLRIALLRHLSDFRDNVVSRSHLGRQLIRVVVFTEQHGSDTIAVLLLLLFSIVAGWALSVTRRRAERARDASARKTKERQQPLRSLVDRCGRTQRSTKP